MNKLVLKKNNRLPKGWKKTKLEEICIPVPTGVKAYPGKKEYYSTGSVKKNDLKKENEYEYDKKPSRANRITKTNDVIQARMKNSEKSLLINNKLNNKLVSTGFIQLRSCNCYDMSKFLFYFIRSPNFLIQRDKFATGTTQIALTDNGFKKIEILLPPYEEQLRIVLKIEEVFSKLLKSKQILENTETYISKFYNSYLKNVFEDNPDVTQDWNVLPLSQLLKEPLRNGRSGLPTKSKEGTLVLKLTAITDNDFSDSNIKLCNIDKRNLDDLWVKKNDILIERSNTPELVGISAIYEGRDNQFIFPDLLIRVRVNEEQILSKFLSLYLSYGKVRKYFQNKAKGISNSFPKISQNDINELKIPFPDISKQKEIIELIELIFLRFNIIRKNKTKILNELSKLNNSMLKQAFEGKLIQQDPNDEPAEIVLQKIKQEKEQLKQIEKAKRVKKNGK